MTYIDGRVEAEAIYNYIGMSRIRATTGIKSIDWFMHLHTNGLELLRADGYNIKHILTIVEIKKKEKGGP